MKRNPTLNALITITILLSYSINISKGYVYLGCYGDIDTPRTQGGNTERDSVNAQLTTYDDSLTPWKCIQTCGGRKYAYSALYNYSTCYCGDAAFLGRTTKYLESYCDTPCSGDFNTVCGGSATFSVYVDETLLQTTDPIFSTLPKEKSENLLQKWEILPTRGRSNWDLKESVNNSVDNIYNIDTSETPFRRAGQSAVMMSNTMVVFGGYSFSFIQQSQVNPNNTNTQNAANLNNTRSREITRFNDLWGFDMITQKWELFHNGSGISPPGRSSHIAIIRKESSSLYIFGGFSDSRVLNDMWRFSFDTRQWTLLHDGKSSGSPTPRGDHAAVQVPGGIILFGGATDSLFYNDVWKFQFESNTWTQIHSGKSNAPYPRGGHTLLLSPYDSNKMIMAFGRGKPTGTNCYNYRLFKDVWSYNIQKNEWSKLSDGSYPWDVTNQRWASDLPRRRYAHTAVMIGAGMLVFGGAHDLYELSDTWGFDIHTHTWKYIEQPIFYPNNRSGHTAVFYDNSMVIFGGECSYDCYYNDVWKWTYNVSTFATTPNSGGLAGRNMAISMGVLWGVLILVVVGVYVPRKAKVIKNHSVKRIQIPDKEIFKINGKDRKKKRNEVDIELEALPSYSGFDKSAFDLLPDEILLRIFGFMEGYELGKLAPVCRRFYFLTNDHIFWHELCKQHWSLMVDQDSDSEGMSSENDEENKEGSLSSNLSAPAVSTNNSTTTTISPVHAGGSASVSGTTVPQSMQPPSEINSQTLVELSKDFYIQKFISFRRNWKEAKMLQVAIAFRTTLIGYLLIVVLSAAVLLIGLKIDGYLRWEWGAIFFPIWILDLLLVVIAGFVVKFYASSRRSKFRNVLRKSFPGYFTSPIASIIIVAFAFCFVLSSILLCLRLKANDADSSHRESLSWITSWTWWAILGPLLGVLMIATMTPFVLIAQQGWTWSRLWTVMVVVCYDITLSLIVARLEQIIEKDYCLLFLPWWISDVFALVAVVSTCMEMRSPRHGWCLTGVYAGYMSTIVTFRSLLCVNLGTVCGDPVAYSYNLIFISLHLFFFLFGIPLIIFLRERFTK